MVGPPGRPHRLAVRIRKQGRCDRYNDILSAGNRGNQCQLPIMTEEDEFSLNLIFQPLCRTLSPRGKHCQSKGGVLPLPLGVPAKKVTVAVSIS